MDSVSSHLLIICITCQLIYLSALIHVPFHALSTVVTLSGEGLQSVLSKVPQN